MIFFKVMCRVVLWTTIKSHYFFQLYVDAPCGNMFKYFAIKFMYYESLFLGFHPFSFSSNHFKFYMKKNFKYWSYILSSIFFIQIFVMTMFNIFFILKCIPDNLVVLIFFLCQNMFFQLQFIPIFYQLLFRRAGILSLLNKGMALSVKNFGMSLPQKFLRCVTVKLIVNCVSNGGNVFLFYYMYGDKLPWWQYSLGVFDCAKFNIIISFHFILSESISTLLENVIDNVSNNLNSSIFFMKDKIDERMKEILIIIEYAKQIERVFDVSCFCVTARIFVVLTTDCTAIGTNIFDETRAVLLENEERWKNISVYVWISITTFLQFCYVVLGGQKKENQVKSHSLKK